MRAAGCRSGCLGFQSCPPPPDYAAWECLALTVGNWEDRLEVGSSDIMLPSARPHVHASQMTLVIINS